MRKHPLPTCIVHDCKVQAISIGPSLCANHRWENPKARQSSTLGHLFEQLAHSGGALVFALGDANLGVDDPIVIVAGEAL